MLAARRVVLVATSALLCTLAACSSFGTAAEQPEAGLAGDAAVGDAGADVTDAASPPDAADAVTPLGPFCRTVGPVTLCDEFDRTDPVGTIWTKSSATQGTSLSIGAGDGGNELRATLPPGTSRAFVRLEKVATRSAGYVSLALDLQVDSAPSGPVQLADVYFGQAAVLTLVLSPQAMDSGLGRLQASIYELQFEGAAPSRTVEHALQDLFSVGSFHRVEIRLDLRTSALVAMLDGKKSLDVMTTLPASTANQNPVTGLVGIVDSNAAGLPLTARARNVVFDLR